MNDRLISAEKLLTKYQDLCEGLACINCPFFGIDNRCEIERMILQEQIVNVPVVRCKNCIYAYPFDEEELKDPLRVGEWRCGYWGSEMHEDDYCSCGERIKKR